MLAKVTDYTIILPKQISSYLDLLYILILKTTLVGVSGPHKDCDVAMA